MLQANANPANIARIQTAILEEFQKFYTGGVTAEELAREQEGLLTERSTNRTQDGALATQLAGQIYTGRTMREVADLEQQIRELTPERVSAAIREHFRPERLAAVVAGDFSKPTTGEAPR